MRDAEKLAQECEAELESATELLAELLSSVEPRTAELTLERHNVLTMHVANAETRAQLLAEAHPSAEARAAGAECLQRARSFDHKLDLNRELYQAFLSVDRSRLDPLARRYAERILQDFRRAGVDKDEATRVRLQELSDRENSLGREFSRTIREDVREIRVDPARLKGLPEDFVRSHPPGADGKVRITTNRPDFTPFMRYATDSAARRDLQRAYRDRAWPANEATLLELLAVRRDKARLLGFQDWADYATEQEMVRSGRNVEEFVERLARATETAARREYRALLDRKREDEPQAEFLGSWDRPYYEEVVRREQFGADARQMRHYLDAERCRMGLLHVTSELFDLEYRHLSDASRWHEDVVAYEVLHAGETLGRMYLDLHPREGKFKGGAAFPVVMGVLGRQLPEAALLLNLPRGPMDHEDLVILFHEFGHLLHHLFSGHQKWLRFSGTASERDFVEAPSQLFEEWAWDVDVLRRFAVHRETGEPIPAELILSARAAADFGRAMRMGIQLCDAALSLRLHQAEPEGLDTTALLREQERRYNVVPSTDGTHFQVSFNHLVNYTARYYTYPWSLVIARDLLSEFQKYGLMDVATARRYRDAVLSPGGSKDAAQLIRDFLGRDFGFEAFERWLAGEPAPARGSGSGAAA
jgi:Zn-dependent oligopeptidase